MAFSDFTFRSVQAAYGLTVIARPLFPNLAIVRVPEWLLVQLARGADIPLVSEKARGELFVMPVLQACRELVTGPLTIYSGVWLSVAGDLELQGECDFLLTRTTPVPEPTAPLVAVVEAIRNDIEAGIGQCIAQMVAARLFNAENRLVLTRTYGCVTTGEAWQFLRLDGSEVVIDPRRYSVANLPPSWESSWP